MARPNLRFGRSNSPSGLPSPAILVGPLPLPRLCRTEGLDTSCASSSGLNRRIYTVVYASVSRRPEARPRESDALRRCPRSLRMSWSRSPPHASAFSLFTSAKPDLGRILVPQAPQSVLRPLRPIGHIVRLRPVLNRLAARANGLTRRPVERTLPSAYLPAPDSARCCDSSASHCPAVHDPDSDPGPAHTTCGYVRRDLQ